MKRFSGKAKLKYGTVNCLSTEYVSRPIFTAAGEEIVFGRAADRLAAYEDTGLEPEEIKELCSDDVAEVLNMIHKIIENGEINHLQELLTAERDGRLVVLPCKVGDTLYSITCGEIKPFVVAGFEMYDKDLIAVEQIKLGRELRAVGKTAFLTREEAEAALKKEDTT